MAGPSVSVTLPVLAVFVGIALPTAAGQTTSAPWWWSGTTSPPADKPCGEFPWSPDNATVDCDYSYYRPYGLSDYSFGTYMYYYGPIIGRCAVNCSDDTPVIGPPVTSSYGPQNYYYCHVNSSTWLGTEPRCEDKPCGEFPWSPDNATVDCDYSYYQTSSLYDYINGTRYYGPFIGRCAVHCTNDVPLIGPPVTSYYGPHNYSNYYCHVNSPTWLGAEPRCEDKPCGEFPWSPANATVDCDYSYYSSSSYHDYMSGTRLYGGLRGRCQVTCRHPLVATGAPLLDPDGGGYYYCHGHSATWLGQEPQCQADPCGPFPWQPTDATVDCDYDYEFYNSSRIYYDRQTRSRFYPAGRCSVTCLNNQTVTGASYLYPDGGNYYYCHPGASTWLGIAPSCQDLKGEVRRCVCEPGWVGDGVHCQDFDECTIVSCGVHQRCVNTPGSHVCECMPGYMEVDGSCQAIHAYYSTYRLLARSFSAALQDPQTHEYINLVAEVVSTLESLYRRTSLAGDFLSVIIIAFRPGSVLVDHVINIRASADFSPAMTSEEVRTLVEEANGTVLGIDLDQIVITDYDECSEPEKTDCSPHAACLNTVGSFSCSCIMGYQDKSPDVTSRPGRVCELEGVSDSWVPAVAGAAAAATVVIIAIATARFLFRAKRKNKIRDVEGHDNPTFAQAAAEPGETASSDP